MDSGCRTGSKGEREGEKSGIELSVIVVRERELSVSVCESVCASVCGLQCRRVLCQQPTELGNHFTPQLSLFPFLG